MHRRAQSPAEAKDRNMEDEQHLRAFSRPAASDDTARAGSGDFGCGSLQRSV